MCLLNGTSKLTDLFFTLSSMSVKQEAVNTNLKVIGLARLGIKSKSTAPEADALTTRPSELLNKYHSTNRPYVSLKFSLDARLPGSSVVTFVIFKSSSASPLVSNPSPSSQKFKFTSPSPHGRSPSLLPCTGGHGMISRPMNSRFLNIHISQICKTRFEKHLARGFKNEEGHRCHYYLVRVFS